MKSAASKCPSRKKRTTRGGSGQLLWGQTLKNTQPLCCSQVTKAPRAFLPCQGESWHWVQVHNQKNLVHNQKLLWCSTLPKVLAFSIVRSRLHCTYEYLTINSSSPARTAQNHWCSHVLRMQNVQNRDCLWKSELRHNCSTDAANSNPCFPPSQVLTSFTPTRKALNYLHSKNYRIDCHCSCSMGGIVQDCQG